MRFFIINKIIRNELFFKGLILTDDISMKALSDNLTDILSKSYNAGCDVILHCNGKLDEVKKLYGHTKKIKKKYYDYFINDILNLKLQKRNISNIKKILSSNKSVAANINGNKNRSTKAVSPPGLFVIVPARFALLINCSAVFVPTPPGIKRPRPSPPVP